MKIINKIKKIKIDIRVMIKLVLLICLLCTFKYIEMNSKINNQKDTIKELNKKLNSNKSKIKELEETNTQLVQQLESK